MVLEHYLAFQYQIELIDQIPNLINLLIPLVLLEFKELCEVSYFLAESMKDGKSLNNLGHLLILHACMIDILVVVFWVLDLYVNTVFCDGHLSGFCYISTHSVSTG